MSSSRHVSLVASSAAPPQVTTAPATPVCLPLADEQASHFPLIKASRADSGSQPYSRLHTFVYHERRRAIQSCHSVSPNLKSVNIDILAGRLVLAIHRSTQRCPRRHLHPLRLCQGSVNLVDLRLHLHRLEELFQRDHHPQLPKAE